MQATLIGSTHGILREIAEPLVESGFKVRALLPKGDRLWNCDAVIEKVEIPNLDGADLVSYLTEHPNLMELNGWFFWSSQNATRALFESDLPAEEKARLLNLRRIEEGSIIGSRVNQVGLLAGLDIAIPKTILIRSISELRADIVDFPAIIKSDLGGGGSGIRDYSETAMTEVERNPSDFLPLLIQERVNGVTVHVDAFYQDGILIYWAYSENIDDSFKYGYHPIRQYVPPTNLDFLEPARLVGRRLGISGPVGIAFIRSHLTHTHLMIEFDTNVGVWHHNFNTFRVNLGDLAVSPSTSFELFQPAHPIRYYDSYRILEISGANGNRWWKIVALLGWRFSKLGVPMPSSFRRDFTLLMRIRSIVRILRFG